MFRNRYWFYKSLYDDYMGREFKLAFGLSCVIWMPHYWYIFIHSGMVSTWTEPSKKGLPTRTTSSSTTLVGTGSLTTSSSKNLSRSSRTGSNYNNSITKVRIQSCRRREAQGSVLVTPLIINIRSIIHNYIIRISNTPIITSSSPASCPADLPTSLISLPLKFWAKSLLPLLFSFEADLPVFFCTRDSRPNLNAPHAPFSLHALFILIRLLSSPFPGSVLFHARYFWGCLWVLAWGSGRIKHLRKWASGFQDPIFEQCGCCCICMIWKDGLLLICPCSGWDERVVFLCRRYGWGCRGRKPSHWDP